ncbi:hypothetical protein B0T40_12735 [Chromobacterium haemolyticum]|uniref:hypothetical protein n=1 Tax=Chromobacterium haemolyticum TaxID=394935 RepID=UPI0009DA254A|nr:hypothetical protein [Chromobacterium haemolyticum]OQS35600.1 hypothetical protein B0T40_12735 [Chromobacterium haemolyticum]
MHKLNQEVAALVRIAAYQSPRIMREAYAGQQHFDIRRFGNHTLELVADMYSLQFEDEERIDPAMQFSSSDWDQEKMVLPSACSREAFYLLYRTGRQLVRSKRRLLQLAPRAA